MKGLVSPPHFVYDFSRIILLMLHSINWPNFIFFYLGFLLLIFMIHRTVGEGEAYLFNFSLPLPPPVHTHLDTGRAIIVWLPLLLEILVNMRITRVFRNKNFFLALKYWCGKWIFKIFNITYDMIINLKTA